MTATIQDFAEQLEPRFVERIRKIFSNDQELTDWLNRPFMGIQGEPTVWERLITEPSFKGSVLDMTCGYPVRRAELPDLNPS